jgi:glycine cleavage system aminomethyltransferase T
VDDRRRPEHRPGRVDVHRFDEFQKSPSYVLARSSQAFQEVYDIIHPQQPMEEPRPLRTSPFYMRQRELGAYFLEASGWERPQWYGSNDSLLADYDVPEMEEWAGRYWSPIVGAEHLATRERVALFDMASLKKAEVTGPGRLSFCRGSTPTSSTSPWQRHLHADARREGGREERHHRRAARGEPLSARAQRAEGHRVDGAAPSGGRFRADPGHLGRDLLRRGLGTAGPRARARPEPRRPLGEAFGFFKARRIYVGEVPVVALRVSYVGELGWELYASADMGLRLWDLLYGAGRPLGVIAGGRGAFSGLRLEKGYRLWGVDMTTEHDPYEAGLGFAVKPDKGDFLGREALLRRREEGPRRRLSCLLLDDPRVVVVGSEPVHSDGEAVGYVTSAGYGYSIGQSIAYAWLPPGLSEEGTKVEVQYFGERHGATVAEEPLFDPAMKRMRG